MSFLSLVELELLYHGRGNWIALTINFVNEDDSKRTGTQFLASIKEELRRQMKNVCRQGLTGFKYSICCQTRKAVLTGKELAIEIKSLSVIAAEESEEYLPKMSKVYNPFDIPLSLKREEYVRINCWFGCLLAEDSRFPIHGEIAETHLTRSYYFLKADALPNIIDISLIRVVSTLIKAKWEEIPVCLGKIATEIPQYREKSKSNLLRAMMVIEDWAAERGQKATVAALVRACQECGIHRNYIEVVYKKKL